MGGAISRVGGAVWEGQLTVINPNFSQGGWRLEESTVARSHCQNFGFVQHETFFFSLLLFLEQCIQHRVFLPLGSAK